MTIIFHEGLPGAGKTYEAVNKRIIPAIQKGRKVFAYIEGLDHEKIADVAAVPLERCKELLVPVERDQVEKIYDVVANDALVILDEAQNFWPSDFRPLGEPMTKFVTEHRHRGLDIVIMGQDLKDVHNLWRRRVDQKIVFTKLDALGKANKYQWATFKSVGNERFEKVTSGTEAYDPKYFGTYKSHEAGTDNKETFVDSRAVIWSSPLFRKWIPLAGLLAVCGLGYVIYMFKGGGLEGAGKAPVRAQTVTTVTVTKTAAPASSATAGPITTQRAASVPSDFIDGLNAKYRPRLTGFFRKKGRAQAVVEWYDDGNRVRERLYANQIEEMGWRLEVSEYAEHVTLVKADRRVVATMWPMDPMGMVSRDTNLGISREGGGTLGGRQMGSVDLAVFDPAERR
ncbi:zonular occludens toxin domain-containing protein [Helicobacter pylori]